MLLKVDCSVIESLKIALTFDDETVKVREISEGDLISVTYNDNGKRRDMEGKIIRIGTNPPSGSRYNCNCKNNWYILIDGSFCFHGERVRISPNNILDLDIILKHTDMQTVTSPADSSMTVHQIRVKDEVFEVSMDYGITWIPIMDLMLLPSKYPHHHHHHRPGCPNDDIEELPGEEEDDMFTEEDRKLLTDSVATMNEVLEKLNAIGNPSQGGTTVDTTALEGKVAEVKTAVDGVLTAVQNIPDNTSKIDTVDGKIDTLTTKVDEVKTLVTPTVTE